MKMNHAAARTAVPEFVAGDRAEDALEDCGAIQRIAKCRAVDVERACIENRNLLDGREQQRRCVIAVRPVRGRWRFRGGCRGTG